MMALRRSLYSYHRCYLQVVTIRGNVFRKYGFESCRSDMEEALDQCKSNDIEFVPFRLRQYVMGNRFNNANVDMVQCLKDVNGNIRDPNLVTNEELERGSVPIGSVKFSSMFHMGFKCLQKHYGENDPELIEENELLDYALQSFMYGFLLKKEHHERCLRTILTTSKEEKITAILANHLFSRLAVNTPSNTYYVSSDYGDKYVCCPCSYSCRDKMWYGDYGIGTELLWYGKPDIMVFPFGASCNIVFPKEMEQEEFIENEHNEKQIIKVYKPSKLLRERLNESQFVSQAITFSFYQKKFQLQQDSHCPPVTLIPTIAFTDRCFDMYMYDTKNDILLRNDGEPISLWNNLESASYATLNLGAVLQLWMLINHLTIKPYLPEPDLDMLKGTCGFTTSLSDERIQKIETDIQMKTKFLDHEGRQINAPKLQLLKSKLLKKNHPT